MQGKIKLNLIFLSTQSIGGLIHKIDNYEWNQSYVNLNQVSYINQE